MKISPNGTAARTNSSGKASEPARRRPNTASAVSGSIATNIYCCTTWTSPSRASSQPKPANATSASAGQYGVGGRAVKLARRRQISHRLIGKMMKPCANVSDLIQISTIDLAVAK